MSVATYDARADLHLDPAVDWLLSRIEQVTVDGETAEALVDGERLRAATPVALERDLGAYVYGTFHAGSTSTSGDEYIPALMEDPELELRLAEATAVKQRVAQLALLDRAPDGSGIIVSLQGVRVFVDRANVVAENGHFARVRVPSVESRLSLGFLFFTSSVGSGSGSRLLRLYRHLANADEAVETWSAFTAWAEERALPLRAKISSRRSGLPRRDALVVYLPSEAWGSVPELAAHLSSDRPQAPTSLFARRIAPGVAASWEPMDPARPRGDISFGEHRSNAIARGVVQGGADPEQRRRAVWRELITVNVDPTAVHRNLDSPTLPL